MRKIMAAVFLVAWLPACNAETRWPVVCKPDEATGFKPEAGEWREWSWRLDDRFVINREGAEGNWRYTVMDDARSTFKSACTLEPNSSDVVCDGEHYLRVNAKTLRFLVAFESGYRDETTGSSDRAFIAIGHCKEGGG
jgi:hypothetical protein